MLFAVRARLLNMPSPCSTDFSCGDKTGALHPTRHVGGFVDLRELLDDAWTEFEATAPVGIDFVAEASLRSMIGSRLMQVAKTGETDRATLKAFALNGL
jgi:hypothetical protein